MLCLLGASLLELLQLVSGLARTSIITDDPEKFLQRFAQVDKKQTLTDEEAEWLEVLAQGWTSDLGGFMNEKQYLKSLHHQDPPVPIVLTCDLPVGWEKTASDPTLGLRYAFQKDVDAAAEPKPVAILRNVQVFEHRVEERIARTFGLIENDYPYVESWIRPAATKNLCGGDLEVLQESWPRSDGLDKYRLTPTQIRHVFKEHDAVFVFQLRNPIHNGHALLMKDTHRQLVSEGYKNPLLWINPLGGWTKEDDVHRRSRFVCK